MRVGVTGHQRLTDEAWPVVADEIATFLAQVEPPLLGLSSLAEGADQVFAEIVLRVGGALTVVLPFAGYRTTLSRNALAKYDELIARAASLVTLKAASSLEASYLAAGRYIVDHADRMVAVWDGRPAAGLGGTADVVEYARHKRTPLFVIDVAAWRP